MLASLNRPNVGAQLPLGASSVPRPRANPHVGWRWYDCILGMMTAPSAIAHYKITAKLGEGGMGAVYRATDTRLNRDVAIKVLPGALANDPDYLARFTREAQLLASLNHSNIAIIHGVEEQALVME